jgi:transcriptional regulator GlxA family with amidase domain
VQIALALYPKFTALDIIGPFQVLADVPGHDVVFVAGEAGPIVDHTGRCPLTATATFADVTAPEIVVVPGELFADRDDRLVRWLRQVHPTTTWTTSVCTGSLYLAAAGILDGVDATTHWARKEQLERLGARYTEQRVVERGKVITAAGVSSGTDMALTLLDRLYGPAVAPERAAGHRIRPTTALRRRLASEGARRHRRPRTGGSRRPHHGVGLDLTRAAVGGARNRRLVIWDRERDG